MTVGGKGRRWLALALLLSACNLSSAARPTATTPALSQRPQVEFLSPANNERLAPGAELALETLARDDGAGIHQVRLFVDDPVGDTQPYAVATVEGRAVAVFRARFIWRGERAKSYLLTVVAYRADGTRSDGASISVHVEE